MSLSDGVLRIARLALLVEAADLAVAEPEQPLQRLAVLQPVAMQRLDDRARHPPQLEHRLTGRDLLELARHGRQRLEMLRDALAADPADQPHLVARPQAPRPLLDRQRGLARRDRHRRGLHVGFEVEQQQRALGQQRIAAHRPQVVQQRQQHQRQVAPAGEHPLEVARQLHHGAHQRVQALRLALTLRGGGEQVLRDVLHLLGQERGAIDLQHPQHALHLVQVGGAALEQRQVVGLLDIALERAARLGQRGVDFATDVIECLRGDFRHAVATFPEDFNYRRAPKSAAPWR
jgi:hypothetical protein